jgi:hypothetical protein
MKYEEGLKEAVKGFEEYEGRVGGEIDDEVDGVCRGFRTIS